MYKYRKTSKFIDFCKQLVKKNNDEYTILKDRFHGLLDNPYHNTGFLKGVLRGKRSDRNGKTRFVFAVCEECRKLGHQKINRCLKCEENPDKTIIFFTLDWRGKAYKK